MRAASGTVSGLFAGRYTIERALGEGATATVFLARDTQAGISVAIKMLRPELAQSAASARFVKEIKRTAALNHPRILPVLDSGDHEGQMYLVLPYMEGGTLRDRLRKEKQLPVDEAIAMIRPIAEALDYAHKQGLIHRDVKPENILFTAGEPVLGDFGIARALETELGETSTSTGIVRGTPAYMSPEQASGSMDYDGRTDIYSLGCVLYEMLAGVPAFIGPTPEAVIAQRFAHPPREIRVYRPSVSPAMEAAISRALTIGPADRYRTASEFAAAIQNALTSTHEVVDPSRSGGTNARRHLVAVGVGAAFLLGVAAVVLVKTGSPRGEGSPVDTTRIAVLPLEQENQAETPWRDNDLLHQALARWRGISIVDRFQVSDAVRRAGGVRTPFAAAEVARTLGAGRYIRGRLTAFGENWRVSASLFDASKPEPLHQAAETFSADFDVASAAFARLADSLLFRGAAIDAPPLRTTGSRSLPAVQAFGRGQLALDDWDLVGADSAFQSALAFDPEYVRARLWLGQVRAWQNRGANVWATVVERALPMLDQLSERERRLTQALVQLARGSYHAACAIYDTLAVQNDRDFAAWFGRGQCRQMNKVVVADSASPSGWKFEWSAQEMMRGYARAFDILPSVHRGYERGAFGRLQVLLGVSNTLFLAYGAPDSAVFYGRPGWQGDSLILVPYPWQQVFSGDPRSLPPGHNIANEKLRSQFRGIAGRWSAAYPTSSGAKQAVAISLELQGDPAAVDTMRAARGLAADAPRRTRLAIAEVLLLVKFGTPSSSDMLTAARTLTDSLLDRRGAVSAEEAELMTPLAALAGRCSIADGLINGRPASPEVPLPAKLLSEALYVAAGAAMGCDDPQTQSARLRRIAADINRQLASVDPAQRNRVLQILLLRPALLTEPLDPTLLRQLRDGSTDANVRAAFAISVGDMVSARRELEASDAQPSTPDLAMARARAWTALRDTNRAITVLDQTLQAVRTYDRNVLDEATTMGSFVSAMVFRADLAKARGDSTNAKRWGVPAAILWAGADARPRARVRPYAASVSSMAR